MNRRRLLTVLFGLSIILFLVVVVRCGNESLCQAIPSAQGCPPSIKESR